MEFDKRFSVSIKQVENGFVVRHEGGWGHSKEYITCTFEEAKLTALRILSETIETQEQGEEIVCTR